MVEPQGLEGALVLESPCAREVRTKLGTSEGNCYINEKQISTVFEPLGTLGLIITTYSTTTKIFWIGLKPTSPHTFPACWLNWNTVYF